MSVVLIVVAHSDDEAIGCSGTIAKHVSNGDKVHLIIMTDGVSSRGQNERQRTSTAEKAASLLVISSLQHFDFPDNAMDSVALINITKVIEKCIAELKPDIVYTHHIGDLNIDHQTTHKAVITACRPQPNFSVKEIYAFEVLSSSEWQTPGYLPFMPSLFVDIGAYIDVKKQVLTLYEDEMRNAPHSRSIENILRLAEFRGNSVGCRYAEAFMIVRVIR